MGYDLNVNGFIGGISEESFDLIKEDLEDLFTEVSFKDNTIKIYSCGNHPDEILGPAFNKIAFCIDADGGGELVADQALEFNPVGTEAVELVAGAQARWRVDHVIRFDIEAAVDAGAELDGLEARYVLLLDAGIRWDEGARATSTDG